MNYSGHAFKEDEKELQATVSKRFKEIERLSDDFKKEFLPSYAHTKFTMTPQTEEAKALSEFDVLIIADGGNLCFGGSCSKRSDGTFYGRYNTD